jgi:hypothetical protein
MPNYTQSKTPFFGRAWSLTITPSQGPSANTPIVVTSDSFEPEALRMTFDITQVAFSAFWHAEITIWNANGPITSGPSAGINVYQAIIQEGDIITVSAGYQADYPYPSIPPAIWTGPVFYTIQDRVDVVDERLTIHCLLNRALTTQNFISATLPALASQFTQAQFIASQSRNKITLGPNVQQMLSLASPQRGAASLPRAKTFFGNPSQYLTALADQNSLLSWFDNKGWHVDSLQFPTGALKATYAPVGVGSGPPQRIGDTTLSLIGQPQQTQLGVNFRVLLDPTIQVEAPLPQVAVALKYVRQAPIPYPLPKGSIPVRPLQNQYVVIGARFVGDTRGNAWYSEITGAAAIQSAIQLLGQSGQADATSN